MLLTSHVTSSVLQALMTANYFSKGVEESLHVPRVCVMGGMEKLTIFLLASILLVLFMQLYS